jgi:hypothetical protein
MVREALYYGSLLAGESQQLSLPRLDADNRTFTPVYEALHSACGSWSSLSSNRARDCCPFIEKGAGAIRWDGNLSPCLPLLHNHTSYSGHLQLDERFSRHWAIGNVTENSLLDLWNTPEHIAFRERVQAFDFSPCTACGGCELSEKNEEDCFGNTFPTCGGCLWAQGVIECP